ncbi:MAG: hypothetical protein RSD64_02760, partial [Christensenellaceae bacterium]
MRKKQLYSLQTLGVTRELKKAMEDDEPHKEKNWQGETVIEYNLYRFYRAKVELVEKERVLQICIFTRKMLTNKKTEPKYRIFLSKNGYTTYDTEEKKWKTAKINNLLYDTNEDIPYKALQEAWCGQKEKKIILNYTKNNHQKPYKAIEEWQWNYKHKKEREIIDHDMALVPKLPKNFEKWVEDTAMIESRYIYYEAGRKVTEGYCTHCKQTVAIENPHYNKKGICPYCKSKIIYKTKKKQGENTTDTGAASILQKTKEGHVVRYFSIWMNFRDYKNKKIECIECLRTVYRKDGTRCRVYELGRYPGTEKIRWIKKRYNIYGEAMESKSVIYEKNIKTALKGCPIQYCAYDIFAKRNIGYKHYPHNYLITAAEKKGIEYVVKMGLDNLVKDLLNDKRVDYLDLKEGSPKKGFGLDKEGINQLRRLNADGRMYETIKEAWDVGIRLKDEEVRFLKENDKSERNFAIYMRHTTPYKMIKYIHDQIKKETNEFDIRDYHDYLQMAAGLGYDLKDPYVLYPKKEKER